MRALAAERPDDRLAADLGSGARWVAQIAPEIRDRLGLAEAGEAAAESDQARFALFDAVGDVPAPRRRRRARRRAPRRPPHGRSALAPAARVPRPGARRRSRARRLDPPRGGPEARPEVEGIFGELSRFGRRIVLGGLDDDDLRRLVAHRTGADPSDDLVRRLAAVTEGNPFFSDEVVRPKLSR